MARYIKANSKVAKYLHLENDRLQLKDGNYILWQGDMTAFGPLPMLNETLAQIGGIALMPHEAKEEQDGTYNRVLPTATDERFVMEEPADTTATDEAEGQAPTPASEGSDDEQPTDEGEADTDSESDTDNPENEKEE